MVHADGHYYRLNGVELLINSSVYRSLPYATEMLAGLDENRMAEPDLVVDYQADKGLQLDWHKPGEKKPLKFYLDYEPAIAGLRSFPAPKQGAFNQALGKKTQRVLDATGGWGGDALLMATQGYEVHILERNPVMALVLREAFTRLARSALVQESPIVMPTVQYANSITALSNYKGRVDCVYLDPMFPPKRKKSAATNKQMQLLQALVGADPDASELLASALASGIKRAVVKRPDYATPLLRAPSQQFSSKLVHYDVYLVV